MQCGVQYSQNKNSVAARNTLQSVLEDVSYTCRASLEDLSLPDSLSIVIHDHWCEDRIEALYYSTGFEDIRIHCAATTDLETGSSRHTPHVLYASKGASKQTKKIFITFYICMSYNFVFFFINCLHQNIYSTVYIRIFILHVYY